MFALRLCSCTFPIYVLQFTEKCYFVSPPSLSNTAVWRLLQRAPKGAGVQEAGQGVVPPVGGGDMFGLFDMFVLISL